MPITYGGRREKTYRQKKQEEQLLPKQVTKQIEKARPDAQAARWRQRNQLSTQSRAALATGSVRWRGERQARQQQAQQPESWFNRVIGLIPPNMHYQGIMGSNVPPVAYTGPAGGNPYQGYDPDLQRARMWIAQNQGNFRPGTIQPAQPNYSWPPGVDLDVWRAYMWRLQNQGQQTQPAAAPRYSGGGGGGGYYPSYGGGGGARSTYTPTPRYSGGIGPQQQANYPRQAPIVNTPRWFQQLVTWNIR